MTTQELKSYIDRILGNNIRLLLPSYWWKRAFGAVIDKIEDSSGVRIVGSTSELEKLDAKVGDIASVGVYSEQAIKISDCLLLPFTPGLVDDWDKLSVVTRIEEKTASLIDTALYLRKSKESLEKGTIIVGCEEGKPVYIKAENGHDFVTTLQEVNDILSQGDYRIAHCIGTSQIDSSFNFYRSTTKSDAYIKGDSWERLAKESDVDAKIIFVDIYNNKANEDNAKAFSAIKNCVLNGKPYVVVGGTSRLLFVSEGTMFVEDFCSLSFKGFGYNETIDGTTTRKFYTATLYADGHVVLGTAVDFAIDSRLSDTSENLVQNKAIKAYIDNAIGNTLNTPV